MPMSKKTDLTIVIKNHDNKQTCKMWGSSSISYTKRPTNKAAMKGTRFVCAFFFLSFFLSSFFLSRYEPGLLRLLQVKLSFFWHVFLLLYRSRNRDFSRLEHLQKRVTYKKRPSLSRRSHDCISRPKIERFSPKQERKTERNRDDSYDLRLQSTKVVCVREGESERERDREREKEKEKLQTQ